MYIYLVEWFCIEQRYIEWVIAESGMKNVAKTTVRNFPSITSTCSQEQARFTDVERKCNSQSLFYIFLDSVLGIFTVSNGAYISQLFCIEHYIQMAHLNALPLQCTLQPHFPLETLWPLEEEKLRNGTTFSMEVNLLAKPIW